MFKTYYLLWLLLIILSEDAWLYFIVYALYGISAEYLPIFFVMALLVPFKRFTSLYIFVLFYSLLYREYDTKYGIKLFLKAFVRSIEKLLPS
jgi:hypothetical protein